MRVQCSWRTSIHRGVKYESMTGSIDHERLRIVCRNKCKFTDGASCTDLIYVASEVHVLLERKRINSSV